MKYIVIPDKTDLAIYQEKGADAFIFGLKNYSIHYPEITLDEIKELSNKYDIFISLNKNIMNQDLEELEEILVELDKTNIKGILFYDLSILSIVERKKLNLDLVWHQTHMVTNYNTCNYYYDKNVKYGYVSNEITLDEIKELSEKTNMKLMVQVFGYPIISHSRRKLLTNYFKDLNQTQKKEVYHLKEKENDCLFLKESNLGTSFFFERIINGTKPLYELLETNIEYFILDMSFIEEKISLTVLETYDEIRKNKSSSREDTIKKMNELIGESTNFFYKKTIYKVKKEK
ncbi:MAG: hypothetical protein E7168_04845 [Firmicutes bacterium]|nr:hypothetical protein [Bacillota bacterium]